MVNEFTMQSLTREMGEGRGISEEQKLENQQIHTPESDLRKTIHLICSLVSLSHSIKVFHVKWQLIRKKLNELNSSLTAVQKFELNEDFKLSELILAIEVTLQHCYDLAHQCVDLSYSGKLLMQSNLDMVSAKLELHIKKLTEVHTSGFLTNAIVVSKPNVGACRDDMKFYATDLLTRLKIGNSEMKCQALVALNEILMEDEKYVRIVIVIDEIASLLVNFLGFPEIGIQEESAKAISVIAGFDSYRTLLIEAGIIAPLIWVLENGTVLGKERAARALQKLTRNSENAWLVSAHGGITALLKLCTAGDDYSGDLIVPASGVLKNLSGVEEIKQFMVAEDAVSSFIKLVRSKDEASQVNAIELLQIVLTGDESMRQMVIREGAIQALVHVLDPSSSFSSKSRETALRAIQSVCFSSSSSLNILMNCKFLDQLLYLLSNGELSIQELAVKVTLDLCGITDEIKKAMGDLGFMPELLRVLDTTSYNVREMAAEVLCSMVLVPRNRKRFVQEDINIGRILQLLDPEKVKSGNNFFLSILMSLTSCNNARRKIMNSGYLKYLEKLAEVENADAKRILRKLCTNRFRNIFNGIWSP